MKPGRNRGKAVEDFPERLLQGHLARLMKRGFRYSLNKPG
jgi:hypothetical protein